MGSSKDLAKHIKVVVSILHYGWVISVYWRNKVIGLNNKCGLMMKLAIMEHIGRINYSQAKSLRQEKFGCPIE